MTKISSVVSRYTNSSVLLKFAFLVSILGFTNADLLAQSSVTLTPVADAYVRNGSYASNNYGSDTSLIVKSATASGFTRSSYLKFSLTTLPNVNSARIRIYGRNTESTSGITISAYSINTDSWVESTITFNNAPTSLAPALNSVSITDQAKYYELDVTDYVKTQFTGDKVVSFLIKDPSNQNKNLTFKSKENSLNRPQLFIETSNGVPTQNNALLFVENPDKFPSNDLFVFSRIQTPWSRDGVTYNANHDSLTVRIHNKGINTLIVNNLILSNSSTWKFEKLKGVAYVPSALPLSIGSGSSADLTLKFIAVDQGTRVSVLNETLTIVSNDDKFPSKSVSLSGVWQRKGEGSNEPYAKEIITAFGFKTNTGFNHTDPNKGDSTTLKGDEIRPSYFVRADASFPVSVRQMSAYHGCCTQSEKIMWHVKGSATTTSVFTHIAKDAQTLLPRKGSPNTPAEGSFTPSTAFGFKIGSKDYTDASKNPSGKIGIRVWKAYDSKGSIIPNSYIISNDYLGSQYTNYDYNDNMYFVKNIKPEKGTAFYSALNAAPSALDFGEKLLQTTNTLQLNLSSLGLTYADGTKDPLLTISSISIIGENKSEFTATMPVKTTLNPQETTTLTVTFKPVSQGLKIADLLIHYNNSLTPHRVPLYGIAKASGVTVNAHYRINSGSSTPLTINGKTWSADNQYSFDNLEPFTNNNLTKITGTDEDALYLKEQSSDGDKRPFRYEMTVTPGNYVVRLHFAEIYWGAPGGGLAGGAGSRVMSVSLENQLRLVNFDVVQEVGGANALVKNIPVTVTDGKLNINFTATVNRPMVNAVEVYSFSTTAQIANKEVSNDTIVKTNTVVISSDPSTSNNNTFDKPKVYPNPLHNNFTIEIPGKYKGKYTAQIVDVYGRIYKISEAILRPGGSTIKMDISKHFLKPGVYFLNIHSDVKKTDVIKLLVE